jgi:hypothetical protein
MDESEIWETCCDEGGLLDDAEAEDDVRNGAASDSPKRGNGCELRGGVAELVERGWRGRLSDLQPAALKVFWPEALAYARCEIGRYAKWRGQDAPVLADGHDAEGVVQAAFERLMRREAGGVPIFYSAEDVRRELRALVKHRVRWLHERMETKLVVNVLPARANGEVVSIFDYLPGQSARPDEAAMEKERERLLGEFKTEFEKTLGKREQLTDVFRRVWDGQKGREIARGMGTGVERARALEKQVNRLLAKFAAAARGGVAEMLDSFHRKE